MTLIPEVHDALARAVARPRPAPRRWWRPSRRAGLLAVGAVVVTGSAVAATTGWHPVIGHGERDRPTAAHTGVPVAQVEALSVLRREQTAADRGPQVRALLRLLTRQEINGVHTDAIRTLRRNGNAFMMLVPVERVGRHDQGYPSSVRRHVLCVFAGYLPAPLGTASVRGQAWAQTCGDLNQLKTTGIGGITHGSNGWTTGALVPDGVTRVVIRLRQHRTVTAAVHDNYYEANTGNETAPGWGVRWLDARGNTIEHRRASP